MGQQQSIAIIVKENGKKSVRSSINVEYGNSIAKFKIKELGDLIVSLNPTATVEVNFSIYNTISYTWMEMFCYYANEERLVVLT